MREFLTEDVPWWMWTLLVVLLAAIVFCFVGYAQALERFKAACEALGGHTSSISTSGVAVGPKGQVSPTFSSTTICLSADGRIIEVA